MVCFSLVWCCVAIVFPGELDTDPVGVRRVLGAMGLGFLACGIFAFGRVRSPEASLFLRYTSLACFHWGGVIGTESGAYTMDLFAFYLLVGVGLAESTFLHLAVSFRKELRQRWLLLLIYLPCVPGLLFLLQTLIVGAGTDWLAGAVFLLSSLYSVVAGIVWIVRVARRDLDGVMMSGGWLLVAALITGVASQLLVEVVLLPETQSSLFNLGLIAVPVSLTYVIVTSRSIGEVDR